MKANEGIGSFIAGLKGTMAGKKEHRRIQKQMARSLHQYISRFNEKPSITGWKKLLTDWFSLIRPDLARNYEFMLQYESLFNDKKIFTIKERKLFFHDKASIELYFSKLYKMMTLFDVSLPHKYQNEMIDAKIIKDNNRKENRKDQKEKETTTDALEKMILGAIHSDPNSFKEIIGDMVVSNPQYAKELNKFIAGLVHDDIEKENWKNRKK